MKNGTLYINNINIVYERWTHKTTIVVFFFKENGNAEKNLFRQQSSVI